MMPRDILIALGILFGCILCLVLGLFPLMAMPFLIVFGWISFLWRVLPQVTVDWSGVATSLGCLLVLGSILQWLGRWAATWPGETKIAWHWTKALVLLGGVVALFWAGLASVGLVRATQWLLQTEDNWFTDRYSPNRTKKINDLKTIAERMHLHNDVLKALPPGATFDARGEALHGWQTLLLPFIEQDYLYKQIRLDLPWSHRANRPHFRKQVMDYEDPYYGGRFDGEFPVTHYAGNVHILGARALHLPNDFPDGTSNTLLIGEAAGKFLPWGRPGNWRDPALGINRSPNGFGHPRFDRAYFALADGSVRFISDKISPATLKALATPAGGEKINDPEW